MNEFNQNQMRISERFSRGQPPNWKWICNTCHLASLWGEPTTLGTAAASAPLPLPGGKLIHSSKCMCYRSLHFYDSLPNTWVCFFQPPSNSGDTRNRPRENDEPDPSPTARKEQRETTVISVPATEVTTIQITKLNSNFFSHPKLDSVIIPYLGELLVIRAGLRLTMISCIACRTAVKAVILILMKIATDKARDRIILYNKLKSMWSLQIVMMIAQIPVLTYSESEIDRHGKNLSCHRSESNTVLCSKNESITRSM